MSEPFLGQITRVGFNFAPRGWALCDGQLLPINQNQALFSILGTTYGGDGRTTFALPDLRGRSAVHEESNMQLGSKGGTESNVTFTPTNADVAGPSSTGGNVNVVTGVSGSGGGRSPYLGVNYIIALQGIFPSRN